MYSLVIGNSRYNFEFLKGINKLQILEIKIYYDDIINNNWFIRIANGKIKWNEENYIIPSVRDYIERTFKLIAFE
jgi:hypothetical protein